MTVRGREIVKDGRLRRLLRRPGTAATLLVLAFGLGFFLGGWRVSRKTSAIYAVTAAEPKPASVPEAERIDLNAADAELLQSLPGIGPALAERIVAYREENGLFTFAYEITDVPGIGSATYEAVRERITVKSEK